MKTLEEKIAALPKWAQEHIQSLNRKMNRLEEDRTEAQSLFNGGKESSVYIGGWGLIDPKIFLPERTITFQMSGGNHSQEIDVAYYYRQHDFDKSSLRIQSNCDPLIIKPCVANVVEISLDKR